VDRLTSVDAESGTPDELGRGEGSIYSINGEKLAIARDADGKLHALSPVCTHLACDVRWNMAERTWDCPCHGSSYMPDGRVINGPATADLEVRPVPQVRTGPAS
jgi:Rieske Fe-S protein